MNTNKEKGSKFGLLMVLFLGLVLAGVLVLVGRNQETRRGAYFAGATMNVLPQTKEVMMGKIAAMTVGATIKEGAKIDGAEVVVNYDSCILRLIPEGIVKNSEAFTQDFFIRKVTAGVGDSCEGTIHFAIGAGTEGELYPLDGKTYVSLATLNFDTMMTGEATVSVDKVRTMLTGFTEADPYNRDREMEIGTVAEAVVKVGPPGGDVVDPSGDFMVKMRFRGVNGETEYGEMVAATAIFLNSAGEAVGEFKTEALRTTEKKGDKIAGVETQSYVYDAAFETTELEEGEKYTVFLLGPKHLARKFCKDGQTERCTDEPGEIVLREAVYDFSGLPLESGDLPEQDGRVNVSDFSKLKEKLNMNPSAEDQAIGDLNFDGAINGADLALLLGTLSEKYGELP